MSFDGYFDSQLQDPKFAAAYWKARCDFIGTKTLALEARVKELEERIETARGIDKNDYIFDGYMRAVWRALNGEES